MQFMYLQRPTKETRTRKMLRPLPQLLQSCRPQQVKLSRLSILFLHRHPSWLSHWYPKKNRGSCTNGCWKRSGRSSHMTLLRRGRSSHMTLLRRKLFWSSLGPYLSLGCEDCICFPAGLEYFFWGQLCSEDML
jgi:hypothetical protein